MNENLNLAPIEELIESGISARQIANELDELMFNYVQTVFYLHLHREDGEDFIHEKTPEHLSYLRELRDAFVRCEELT